MRRDPGLGMIMAMLYGFMPKFHNPPGLDPKIVNPPQSEESKQFYLKRAQEKKERKAKRGW